MHISIQVWEMREIEYLEQNSKMDFLGKYSNIYKAREINRHFPCIPGSSKHFFETKTKLADAQTVVFIPKKSRHFKFNYNGYFSKNYQVKFY